MPRIILGALSGLQHEDRRDRCRKTWFQQYHDVECRFLIGGADSFQAVEMRGDNLILPCPDDYPSLPQKTREFCRWALTRDDWQHLFKCDDDTYVDIGRLAECDVSGKDYVGLMIGGYASGGAGYFLSRRAAQIVAEKLVDQTGDEDLLVGKHLREAGVSLVNDSRFHGWPHFADIPHAGNNSITSHGWRDDTMIAIHAQAQDTGPWPLFGTAEIRAYKSSYGALGVGGALGFDVDGSSETNQPPPDGHMCMPVIVSAHAPSVISIHTSESITVTGMLDSRAAPRAPVRFKRGEFCFGALADRRTSTFPITLEPGLHSLAAEIDGVNARAYSLWAISPAQPVQWDRAVRPKATIPPIVMPTTPAYDLVLATTLTLLDRHWPEHPDVTVVSGGPSPAGERLAAHTRSTGEHNWPASLLAYLDTVDDDVILLMLDDYALFCPPRDVLIAEAAAIMAMHPDVDSIMLTGMEPSGLEPFPPDRRFGIYPRWEYTVHTQAALWRVATLAKICRAVARVSPWDYETLGSRIVNRGDLGDVLILQELRTCGAPLFLDSDPLKDRWALPYHNLFRGGEFDSRHEAFMRAENLPIPHKV